MAKSLIKRRREAKAICDRCHSPDYTIYPAYYDCGKINFKCNSCGNSWQYGYDGGIYAKLADKEGTIEDFEGINNV